MSLALLPGAIARGVLLKRMTSGEDGIMDALCRFSHTVSGAYFWCPGLRGKHLELTPTSL